LKRTKGTVVFTNVASLWTMKEGHIASTFDSNVAHRNVVFRDGQLVCYGHPGSCMSFADDDADFVDLEGGSVTPGIVAVGSGLGLAEIAMESSTTDGPVFDALRADPPAIIGGAEAVIRAVDGLQFSTRDAL
jgi:imidazolonepropionase-like amidohydrolase